MRKGTTRRRLTLALAAVAVAGLTAGAAGAVARLGERRGPLAARSRSRSTAGGEERDPLHRRRHGRARDHARPQLRVRRRRPLRASTRCPSPATSRPTSRAGERPDRARLRPRLGRDRHRLGDRVEDLQRRASRPTRSPTRTLTTILEIAQAGGLRDRQRHDRRAHRRDAGRARLPRHAARLPGPGRHGHAARSDAKRPAARARSPSRPSTTASTCILGGGASRFDQTVQPAARSPARRCCSRPTRRATQLVTDRAGLEPRPARGKVLGLFAPATWTIEWNGAAARLPGAPARSAAHETTAPGPPPSRTLADMTNKAIDLLDGRSPKDGEGLLPAGRGRLDRQAGPRRRPVRPDRRDGRVRPAVQVGLDVRRRRTPTRSWW